MNQPTILPYDYHLSNAIYEQLQRDQTQTVWHPLFDDLGLYVLAETLRTALAEEKP